MVPSTGQSFAAEVITPGEMVFGTTDPGDEDFDSRSTWSAEGRVIEIRAPYQAIGFSDPSSLQAYRIDADGSVGTETVDRVGITIVVGDEVFETSSYAWEPWQTPAWHERVKDGAEVFAEAVIAANTG